MFSCLIWSIAISFFINCNGLRRFRLGMQNIFNQETLNAFNISQDDQILFLSFYCDCCNEQRGLSKTRSIYRFPIRSTTKYAYMHSCKLNRKYITMSEFKPNHFNNIQLHSQMYIAACRPIEWLLIRFPCF